MMSGIRSKNTKPEILVRKGLHGLGFRFRIHAKLPGKPDLVLSKYRAAIFVHGCFWHGHDCPLFRLPGTRTAFWKAKISRNQENDRKAVAALGQLGWRTLTIWECAMRGTTRLDPHVLLDRSARWIRGSRKVSEIRG